MAGNITNAVYDLTNVTNSENTLQFIQAVNDLTGQWFMLGILISIFIIIFAALQSPLQGGNKDALTAAAFVSSVLALFFITLEFISLAVALLFLLVMAILVTFTILKDT